MSEKTPTPAPQAAPATTKPSPATGRGPRPAGGAAMLRGLPFGAQEAALAPGGALEVDARPRADGATGGGGALTAPRFAGAGRGVGGGGAGGDGPQQVGRAAEAAGDEVTETAIKREGGGAVEVCDQPEGPQQTPFLPDLEPKRAEAHAALGQLSNAVHVLVQEVISWQQNAWSMVLHETGADPFIALTSGEWHALFMAPFASSLGAAMGGTPGASAERGGGAASSLKPKPRGGPLEGWADAAGNTAFEQGLTGAGERMVKPVEKGLVGAGGQMVKSVVAVGGGEGGKLSRLLLGAFAGIGVPGLVLGTLVNVVWSVVSDLIFGDEEREKVIHEARTDATDIQTVLRQQLEGLGVGVVAQWQGHYNALADCVTTTTDGVDLDRIAAWAKASLPAVRVSPPSFKALGMDLLAHWRRQRANSEDEANAYTTGTAFETVTDKLGKDAPGLDGRRFIDQAKFEWARRGLELDGPVAKLEAAWAQVQGLPPAQRLLRLLLLPAVALPRFRDVEVFARTTRDVGGIAPESCADEDLAAVAVEGGLALTCRVVVAPVGEAIVAERFVYDLKVKPGFHAERDFGCRDGQPDSRALPRHWEEVQ